MISAKDFLNYRFNELNSKLEHNLLRAKVVDAMEQYSLEVAVNLVKNFNAPAVKVRFNPKDVDETFAGTVIVETQYSYLVIPDHNPTGTARWNKKCCDVLP